MDIFAKLQKKKKKTMNYAFYLKIIELFYKYFKTTLECGNHNNFRQELRFKIMWQWLETRCGDLNFHFRS